MQASPQTDNDVQQTFVKTWMLIRAGAAGVVPSSLRHLHADFLLCKVERVRESRKVQSLRISAYVSHKLDVPDHAHASPSAILDQYHTQSSHVAPAWVQWDQSRYFENGRASFIGMFVDMALWPQNLDRPNLAIDMINWAQMISAGTWAESERLGPITPLRPTVARNTKQRRQRHWRGVQQSTGAVNTPSRGVGDEGDDSDESWDGGLYASEASSAAEYPLEPLQRVL
ncbi:hypothetical protein DFH06DRAFT_1155344 [Mycena polygramma]|nr:hypothetical protein DFH06DRAFT_1247507 [Mycena polygramma]KAJ7684331.1 hypothetical protein DFH06DRAFT_1155344 [Mycena polygramma]